ncbi:hypothetical protein Dda_6534 [Drechslerella dactyloides]|uniref:Uncharacterized protein n=1 Tax=Drechslerella dactyloides TaxID=74499 RepID=A0AAD6IY00_DREDA|nr:hypothetical protein Dda_6534 [Drechslerella dactyloides]
MLSQNLLVAALCITASAIPIANQPSSINKRAALLDGLLGGLLGSSTTTTGDGLGVGGEGSNQVIDDPTRSNKAPRAALLDGLVGGLLGSGTTTTGDGLGVGGETGGLPVGSSTHSGKGGLLRRDALGNGGGLLGGLLGGTGGDGNDGLVGGLLNGLLGGTPAMRPGVDPLRQHVEAGNVESAEPQVGFRFTNIEIYSPPVGLIQGLIQLLLGGRRSTFITRVPMGGDIKTTAGLRFDVNPTSVQALCFASDITGGATWTQTACSLQVDGYVNGQFVGSLEPQIFDTAKFIGRAGNKNVARSPKKTNGAAFMQDMAVDEIKLMFTPTDPNVKIMSVVLDLDLSILN